MFWGLLAFFLTVGFVSVAASAGVPAWVPLLVIVLALVSVWRFVPKTRTEKKADD